MGECNSVVDPRCLFQAEQRFPENEIFVKKPVNKHPPHNLDIFLPAERSSVQAPLRKNFYPLLFAQSTATEFPGSHIAGDSFFEVTHSLTVDRKGFIAFVSGLHLNRSWESENDKIAATLATRDMMKFYKKQPDTPWKMLERYGYEKQKIYRNNLEKYQDRVAIDQLNQNAPTLVEWAFLSGKVFVSTYPLTGALGKTATFAAGVGGAISISEDKAAKWLGQRLGHVSFSVRSDEQAEQGKVLTYEADRNPYLLYEILYDIAALEKTDPKAGKDFNDFLHSQAGERPLTFESKMLPDGTVSNAITRERLAAFFGEENLDEILKAGGITLDIGGNSSSDQIFTLAYNPDHFSLLPEEPITVLSLAREQLPPDQLARIQASFNKSFKDGVDELKKHVDEEVSVKLDELLKHITKSNPQKQELIDRVAALLDKGDLSEAEAMSILSSYGVGPGEIGVNHNMQTALKKAQDQRVAAMYIAQEGLATMSYFIGLKDPKSAAIVNYMGSTAIEMATLVPILISAFGAYGVAIYVGLKVLGLQRILGKKGKSETQVLQEYLKQMFTHLEAVLRNMEARLMYKLDGIENEIKELKSFVKSTLARIETDTETIAADLIQMASRQREIMEGINRIRAQVQNGFADRFSNDYHLVRNRCGADAKKESLRAHFDDCVVRFKTLAVDAAANNTLAQGTPTLFTPPDTSASQDTQALYGQLRALLGSKETIKDAFFIYKNINFFRQFAAANGVKFNDSKDVVNPYVWLLAAADLSTLYDRFKDVSIEQLFTQRGTETITEVAAAGRRFLEMNAALSNEEAQGGKVLLEKLAEQVSDTEKEFWHLFKTAGNTWLHQKNPNYSTGRRTSDAFLVDRALNQAQGIDLFGNANQSDFTYNTDQISARVASPIFGHEASKAYHFDLPPVVLNEVPSVFRLAEALKLGHIEWSIDHDGFVGFKHKEEVIEERTRYCIQDRNVTCSPVEEPVRSATGEGARFKQELVKFTHPITGFNVTFQRRQYYKFSRANTDAFDFISLPHDEAKLQRERELFRKYAAVRVFPSPQGKFSEAELKELQKARREFFPAVYVEKKPGGRSYVEHQNKQVGAYRFRLRGKFMVNPTLDERKKAPTEIVFWDKRVNVGPSDAIPFLWEDEQNRDIAKRTVEEGIPALLHKYYYHKTQNPDLPFLLEKGARIEDLPADQNGAKVVEELVNSRLKGLQASFTGEVLRHLNGEMTSIPRSSEIEINQSKYRGLNRALYAYLYLIYQEKPVVTDGEKWDPSVLANPSIFSGVLTPDGRIDGEKLLREIKNADNPKSQHYPIPIGNLQAPPKQNQDEVAKMLDHLELQAAFFNGALEALGAE